MNMTEINMHFDLDDLKGIYFEDGQQRFFFGPNTKRQSAVLVIAALIFPFFMQYSLQYHDNWLLIIGSLAFGVVIYDFWRVAKPIIIWKKTVEAFLIHTGNAKEVKMKYNGDHFLHEQDGIEEKIQWTAVSNATVTDRFIRLQVGNGFLFPRSAMNADEFKALSEMVVSRVAFVKNE
jgi:hypothetical protein